MKTTRRKEPCVELAALPIPYGVMSRHWEVTVCFAVMFVNGIAFAVSIGRSTKFCTAEALENHKASANLTSLKRINATYAHRGFLANRVSADNEFSALDVPLSNEGMTLNVVARYEPVLEVKRHIRTLKERCLATYNMLPYKEMPNRMTVETLYAMTFWLHVFQVRDGISATVNPREFVTGIVIEAKRHSVILFGANAQTHEQYDNTMANRTISAIALHLTRNAHGGHYFFNLQTGRKIHRNR